MNITNPFAVSSPESLTPREISRLFVDVFSDFPKIRDNSHTFIHGHRGTGKSMMLRYLEPLVQIEAKKYKIINDIPCFAVHIPIRNAQISVSEWNRLTGAAYDILAEHMLVMHVSIRIFKSINDIYTESSKKETYHFLKGSFVPLMELFGWEDQHLKKFKQSSSKISPIQAIEQACTKQFSHVITYLNSIALRQEPLPYIGPLCNFLDFLVPLAQSIKELSFTPNGPLFLMIDDADNLPLGMQKLLNTWVSCRTNNDVCLKISTQLNYKTFLTSSNRLIESPHDFNEININTIYTSNKDHYYNRISNIVKKRLYEIHNIDIKAEDFFPYNLVQQEKIDKIKLELKQAWQAKKAAGRGSYRPSDESSRYAIAEYMRRELAGKSKSLHTYSYAGFKNIVDISSGVIRWFLEPASRMFSEASSLGSLSPKSIDHITHQIQDKVLKEWSEEFMVADFDKLTKTISSECENTNCCGSFLPHKLFRLITSLGSLFHKKLLIEGDTERHIISFMICDSIDQELEQVLSLGVEWGYFLKSSIASKEGYGKKPLYILNRRLAPYFRLDPGGYAAHLSITSSALKIACENTDRFVRERLKEATSNNKQLQLLLDGLELDT